MSLDHPRRLISLIVLLLLVTSLVVADATEAQARPLPSNLQVDVASDCTTTLSWSEGRGWIYVRLNLRAPDNGQLETHTQRVHTRDGLLVHDWLVDAGAGYQVTAYVYTAKGRGGAYGDFIYSTGLLCE